MIRQKKLGGKFKFVRHAQGIGLCDECFILLICVRISRLSLYMCGLLVGSLKDLTFTQQDQKVDDVIVLFKLMVFRVSVQAIFTSALLVLL